MDFSRNFNLVRLKYIKDNYGKQEQEPLIYYSMMYHNTISNLAGIILMVGFIFLFKTIGQNNRWQPAIGPVLGMIIGALCYFLILVIMAYFKRKFFYKYKLEIITYVNNKIKEI